MNIQEAIKELRKNEKLKFDQTIDLIVNLRGIDPKKESISAVIDLPNEIKKKRVCGFLSQRSELVDTITPLDFTKYKEKKPMKALVKNYDFFIAEAKLMPSVATNFGKILGPTGKMPSPQLGVLMQDDSKTLKNTLERISKAIKVRVKEASLKVPVGKESMDDVKIIENITSVYNGIVNVLPTKKENVRSVLIKLTMSKPVKVEMK